MEGQIEEKTEAGWAGVGQGVRVICPLTDATEAAKKKMQISVKTRFRLVLQLSSTLRIFHHRKASTHRPLSHTEYRHCGK